MNHVILSGTIVGEPSMYSTRNGRSISKVWLEVTAKNRLRVTLVAFASQAEQLAAVEDGTKVVVVGRISPNRNGELEIAVSNVHDVDEYEDVFGTMYGEEPQDND